VFTRLGDEVSDVPKTLTRLIQTVDPKPSPTLRG
jgi:hypothetical protein